MPRKVKADERPYPARVWRHSQQLRGVRSILTRDINLCTDGATVTVDWKTAQNLIEIIDQAIHTEEGYGV